MKIYNKDKDYIKKSQLFSTGRYAAWTNRYLVIIIGLLVYAIWWKL